MEPLLWAVGAVLIVVCGVCLYTVLRLRSAEKWILEAREAAPVKKIEALNALAMAMRKEFTTVLEEIEEKHDRWKREQASLRSYIHRRIGKEDQSGSQASDDVPDRIVASDPRAGGGSLPTEAQEDRQSIKRKIKEAYYATRR